LEEHLKYTCLNNVNIMANMILGLQCCVSVAVDEVVIITDEWKGCRRKQV
jgi:hypothetical protein